MLATFLQLLRRPVEQAREDGRRRGPRHRPLDARRRRSSSSAFALLGDLWNCALAQAPQRASLDPEQPPGCPALARRRGTRPGLAVHRLTRHGAAVATSASGSRSSSARASSSASPPRSIPTSRSPRSSTASSRPAGRRSCSRTPKGSQHPLLINQFGTERRMCLAFGVERLDDVAAKLGDVLEHAAAAGARREGARACGS